MALFVLMVTFFVWGAGNYRARTDLVHLGGYLDLVTRAGGIPDLRRGVRGCARA